jgi:hypothetical protein
MSRQALIKGGKRMRPRAQLRIQNPPLICTVVVAMANMTEWTLTLS